MSLPRRYSSDTLLLDRPTAKAYSLAMLERVCIVADWLWNQIQPLYTEMLRNGAGKDSAGNDFKPTPAIKVS